MTTFLLEFAIRTTLIAIGTAVVLRLLRIRAATLRHGAWTAVVVAMLVLPVWLAGGVRLSLPVLTPAPEVSNDAGATNRTRPAGAVQPPAVAETQTFDAEAPAAPSSNAPALPALDWQTAVLSLYLTGALVLMLRLLVGTVQANRLRRGAVLQDGRLTSTRCITPITVGWFAPSLILPEGWQHWSAPKLDAVLTHEQAHARRHDTLVQWFALLNRAICWFHPLAWWLERRLSVLAEEACDAAVIAAGHSPHDYSQYLLEMARSVSRDGGRLASIGMAMPGTGLTHRVRLLFQGLPAMRVSRARLACTIAFCAASSVMFAAGAIGERARQQKEAQSPIRFDVVSIKPCAALPPPGAGRGVPGWAGQISPGYLHWDCVKLSELIDQAYTGDDNQLLNVVKNPRPDSPKRVRGGPSWIDQERFTIEIRMSGDAALAKPEGASQRFLAVREAMKPTLRAMLEERFQLKLRKATEEQPMYALTVTKSGLNPERVKPVVPGDCRTQLKVTVGNTRLPDDIAKLPACGTSNWTRPQGNFAIRHTSFSMAQFATALSNTMDRYVLDKTGIEGRFNFGYEFGPDGSTPGTAADDELEAEVRAAAERMGRNVPAPAERPAPDGPTIFKALEGLGLRLEPTKGPAEYLQIDSVQRPRPNGPEPDPPARAQGAGPVAQQPDGSTEDRPEAPAQAPSPQAPQITFEAVSIKPCTDFGPGAGRGGNSPRISMTPGYAHFGCITLANLIDHAWGGGSFPENSLLNTPRLPPDTRPDLPKRVRGGPSWVEDDRWEIEIRMSGDKSDRTGAAFHDWVLTAMTPVLRTMIEDRFQLKLRKATEQRPMYAMTIAPGGLKITQTAPQKCWERPWNTPRGEPGTPPPGFEGTPSCGYGASSGGGIGQRAAGAPVAPPAPSASERRVDRVVNFTNINLADFADWLTRILDHGVLNRTSVEGRFSFPLEYAVDDNTPGDTQSARRSTEAFNGLRAQNGLPPEPAREPSQPKGPTIYKALETLGLKLSKTTGPAEYLLIESVQRPRPNPPSPTGLRRDRSAGDESGR